MSLNITLNPTTSLYCPNDIVLSIQTQETLNAAVAACVHQRQFTREPFTLHYADGKTREWDIYIGEDKVLNWGKIGQYHAADLFTNRIDNSKNVIHKYLKETAKAIREEGRTIGIER